MFLEIFFRSTTPILAEHREVSPWGMHLGYSLNVGEDHWHQVFLGSLTLKKHLQT
jgi:hypothetical protein